MKNLITTTLLVSILLTGCINKERSEYILDEIDLIPECIAYSSKTNQFYISSLYKSKIISLDAETGAQEDFISSNEYGFAHGVGILVDEERGLLHALSGYYQMEDFSTHLHTFNLYTKELVKKYSLPGYDLNFLNDLIMDGEGNLYMTDTKDSSIYTLKSGADSLERFIQSDEIHYPNGIAISDDYTKLYIATYNNGVRILDIESKQFLNKADQKEDYSQRIDGLEFYEGNLYGIQKFSDKIPNNFKKLTLNEAQDQIIETKMIDHRAQNKWLKKPLTFCISNNKAVVIANSNLPYLDQKNYVIHSPDSLEKTRLLIYDLKIN